MSELSPTLIALVNLDRIRGERDQAAKDGTLSGFVARSRETLRLIQSMLDGEVRPTEDLRVLEGKRNALKAVLDGENAFAISAARRARHALSEDENNMRSNTETSWGELVTKWARERNKDAKSKKAHEAVTRWFVERVGGKTVEKITKKDIILFKDKLVEEGVGPSNINVKLTRLRTLLNFAYMNDLVAIKAAEGIRVHDYEAAKNRRKPFDEAALVRLLSGPVHSSGERPSGGKGEAAFWLPLLALFTGARMEELGQLRPRDVVRQHVRSGQTSLPVWVIHIRADDADGLKLKNEGSERIVPVHNALIRLGFTSFCESAVNEGRAWLFPDLKPNVHGVRTAKWGEWFSRYLRGVCGVSDSRIVFHSLRHTFKDCARNSGIEEGMQRQIMGHAGRDVADTYGSGYSLEKISNAITRYEIPNDAQNIIDSLQSLQYK
ncbi:hypothetical protein E4M02_02445 [Brevundimonas sp. S30B]|uniref:site-specific integrase n=1 Tax=unclassified Brevundimonas TaxID=2622653 RepID=UPI0010722F3A|nr:MULTISPECIES: site-specific integrase [unclassified Brevundimonas]QBX37250.1 hypothetical protein E4M01_05375 [Brevundimonas sp. MF30-B]TFW03957.1 hypothetical protein E4M02_02445 [Brevundimonas sp. S30B]